MLLYRHGHKEACSKFWPYICCLQVAAITGKTRNAVYAEIRIGQPNPYPSTPNRKCSFLNLSIIFFYLYAFCTASSITSNEDPYDKLISRLSTHTNEYNKPWKLHCLRVLQIVLTVFIFVNLHLQIIPDKKSIKSFLSWILINFQLLIIKERSQKFSLPIDLKILLDFTYKGRKLKL